MKQLIFLIGLLVPFVSSASEFPQVFIGAKGGYQWAFDDTYNYSEPSASIFGVYGGLHLSPTWRWDVGYQYQDILEGDATSVSVDTWLMESAIRYDWYFQDNLSLYGRLGLAYWDVEKTHPSTDTLHATGFSPLGEVGMSYDFMPNFKVSAGYQYIDSIGESNTGRYDSHGVLVNLTYTFQRGEQSTLVETAPIAEKALFVVKKEAAPIEAVPQTFVYSPEDISDFLGVDSTELSQEFVEWLMEAALILNRYPQSHVIIEGHADSSGSKEHNQKLSERRAITVVDQLVGFGVIPSQIQWQGKGDSHPIADNKTANGRAQNRRVDVAISSFQYQE